MKVSLNTIKELTAVDLSIDELVQRINQQLGGVEEVIDLGAKYKDAVIVKVVECDKHPNADKLSVCRIDDGGVRENVERGEDGLVQVVCGAPNVHADMWAVWLPPESIVPSTHGASDEFKLGSRELRGVMSNGMLAAGDELAINNEHDGITEITEKDIKPRNQYLQERTLKQVTRELKAGVGFAEMFELDDTIIDIENKMFTHRPDLFGQLGVAREIAGIQGQQFDDPKWYYELEEAMQSSGSCELKTFNECGDKVSRLWLVGMDNVTTGPSPLWLQTRLVAFGGKPINNVVDITNYIMYMTAQPTHAYDYDKLRGGTVGARMAQDGEKITLLNGKTYELAADDIVIADGEGAIGLGGVMGGLDSEVSASTTRIVLEVANFDMYTVRKTSMRYGLFTDALTRFNKGQSMLMNPYVGQHAVQLLTELAGAKQATPILDDLMTSDTEWRTKPSVVSMLEAKNIKASFINQRLGLELSAPEIMTLLTNVGFECEQQSNDEFSYWSPAWRMDIQGPEDVVEEVGRLYGFDKLPRELPQRSIVPPAKNANIEIKRLVRDSLAKAGANEVLTYSFVHENVMKKAEQDVAQAFQLSNALSPDLQYYRLSVLPSLLDKVHMNIKAGHDEFTLFEIGKGHNKKYHATDDNGLPKEIEFVDVVYAGKKPGDGSAYYQLRRMLDQLAQDLGLNLVYEPIDEMPDVPVSAPFDPVRSAMVQTTQGVFLGMIGELKQTVIQSFKLPTYTAAMTLDIQAIREAHATKIPSYTPLSRYPSIAQDVSVIVPQQTAYRQVFETVERAIQQLSTDIETRISPVTLYQAPGDTASKTVTLRIRAISHERTLTVDEVTNLVETAAAQARETLGIS